jgi:hypothetical protein
MRRFVAIALTTLAGLAGTAEAHRTASKPSWMTDFAWRVAICETGKGHNHPDYRHRSGVYGGAWGWYVGTWQLDRLHGMPRFPWNATPRQQYRVFQIGRTKGRYWGCIANRRY